MDSIQAEKKHLNYLKSFSEYDGVSIGLIIGQVSGQKCTVIHLAPTPEQSKLENLSNLKAFDQAGLSDHARYVVRMLPGGLDIVGVFIITNTDVFTAVNIPTLRKILQTVEDELKGDLFPEKLHFGSLVTLHYYGTKNELSVKRFELDTLKNVDCSFKDETITWFEINTNFFLSEHFFEDKSQVSFSDNLKNWLEKVKSEMKEMEFYLEDKKFEPKTRLEAVVAKTAKDSPLTGTLYRLLDKREPKKMNSSDSPEQLFIAGCVPSKIFVQARSTVQDATQAVKQDILRSLAARFEMHVDSLVDEADGSPEENERVHEPPLRVLLRPTGWKIMIADYIFPGEGRQEVIKSCKELFDVDVEADDIFDNFETWTDMMDSKLPGDTEKPSSKQLMVLGGAVVLLAGVYLHYLYFLN